MIKLKDINNIFLRILSSNVQGVDVDSAIAEFSDDDWNALLKIALSNRLFPQFYNSILSLSLQNVPEKFINKFKDLYIYNFKSNLLIENEQARVLSYLKKQKIKVMPLKGPFLARFIYGDIALRHASIDIDLVVAESKMSDIEDIAINCGYNLSANKYLARLKYAFRGDIEFSKRSGAQSFHLDIHSDFHDRVSANQISQFWADAREIDLGDHKVLFPSTEDLILYLSLLAISRAECICLKYLYDMHQLINSYGSSIDWGSLFYKAKRVKITPLLSGSLYLIKNLFRTEIKEEMVSKYKLSQIKKEFLVAWLKKKDIISLQLNRYDYYIWRCFLTHYIYASDVIDFLRLVYKNSVFFCMKFLSRKLAFNK
ncbi:nucleotidyltransferase family protein [Candidatus Omnitrophota bacterium]